MRARPQLVMAIGSELTLIGRCGMQLLQQQRPMLTFVLAIRTAAADWVRLLRFCS